MFTALKVTGNLYMKPRVSQEFKTKSCPVYLLVNLKYYNETPWSPYSTKPKQCKPYIGQAIPK